MPLTLAVSTLALCATTWTAAQAAAQRINFEPCPGLNANISALTGIPGTPFDCAQLLVPLDYTNSQSPSLNLSLFRVNATEEPVLGSVLINFGGPGGTGAENLPVVAEEARKNIGAQWDLVSWDPRGTGYTIPFNCSIATMVATDPTAQKRDLGTLAGINLTEVFLTSGWDTAGQTADFCFEQVGHETGTLIGTAFVARDMMEIVDALGEDGLLRFYGWSYGTALGSYAAAMFPERIERMVLDANLNPHDYQSGTYRDLTTDTDEAFAGFLEACFNVTDDCALYSLVQPNTTQDLLDVLNSVLKPLAQNATLSAEAFQTYFALKSIFIEPLYYPTTWPSFAQTLVNLLTETPNPSESDPSPPVYGEAELALLGIRASDATFHANSSDEYLPIVEYTSQVSPSFSDLFNSLWPSARWRMPAKERYWGDFQATTKTPILFINGMFDPATPIVGAYNASAGFEGSVVLPHSGYGHGIFVSPSECVAEHIRAYFQNGSLPSGNVSCAPDMTPVELWRSIVQESTGNSTSESNGNSTTNGNGAAEDVEGGASAWKSSLTLAITAGVLAVAVANVL
ncbi:uncharacterized protein A1O9_12903 [Exophiala aquamarina CBS 119918]|uniref:Uncharacterized protein n=1 Tax=Exophiala aquamarina CBS 119918 TaxID=1182545 RepID=A0A072NVI4_9EURO|nr:uncharacterized protein A1O9_12903 [Exophiala aquamarina CBS 119918]KEF51053.1 hypothetical protein A1O9_12903 [Exophiala aquamarina CBS 119918]